MLILLPVVFLLLAVVFYADSKDIYTSSLRAVTAFGVLLVAGCEILSVFSQLRFWPLVFYWLVCGFVIFFLFKKRFFQGVQRIRTTKIKPLDFGEWLCVCTILVFASLTLLAIPLYPPASNYDSLVYHLPRVFFWAKNGSVYHYATNVARQLVSGPLASFFVLNVYLLDGTADKFVGIVQWFAYIGSMFSVAAISKTLGASRRGQFYAAVLVATVPIAILQSHTAQSDLFVAFWCTVCVYFLMDYIVHHLGEKISKISAVFIGLSAGLCVLSKLTGSVVVIGFFVMLLIYAIKSMPIRLLVLQGAIVALCAIAVFSGFFIRNALVFNGDGFGLSAPEMTTGIHPNTNERIVSTAMNFSRNFLTNNLKSSDEIGSRIDWLVEVLGVDLKVSDPRSPVLVFGTAYLPFEGIINSHDSAPSPQHALLMLFSWIICIIVVVKNIIAKKPFTGSVLLSYIFFSALAYFLICATAQYSASLSRYLMAPLLLSLAAAPILFEKNEIGKSFLSLALCLIVLGSFRYTIFDAATPLVDDYALQTDMKMIVFGHIAPVQKMSRGDYRASTVALPGDTAGFYEFVNKTLGYSKIGLKYPISISIYPWLYYWRDNRKDVRYIEAIYNAQKEDAAFVPDVILTNASTGEKTISYHSSTYSLIDQYSIFGLYLKNS